MPKKVSCALIGGGIGPMVRVGGYGELRISGLPDGEHVRLLCRTPEEIKEVVVAENGRFAVEDADSIQVIYEGGAKTFCAMLEN